MALTEIAKWVKKRRMGKRLSQAALGDLIGKSRTWVSSLECGTFRPKVQEAIALADVLGDEPGTVLAMAGYPMSVLASLRPAAAANEEQGRYLTDAEIDEIAGRAAAEAIRRYRDLEGRSA